MARSGRGDTITHLIPSHHDLFLGGDTRSIATPCTRWKLRCRELTAVRAARCASWPPVNLAISGSVNQDGLSLPVRIDAPIGTEKPIPEIVDYRKIAISMPVVQKMELLLSPEPGKSSQP